MTNPRPCVECGTTTTGSTGAAGLRWPMLCQTCKDKADIALEARCRLQATAIRYGAESANRVLNEQAKTDKLIDAIRNADTVGRDLGAGVEDPEPFDPMTGPMEPEYNPDDDAHYGDVSDIARRVREYGA